MFIFSVTSVSPLLNPDGPAQIRSSSVIVLSRPARISFTTRKAGAEALEHALASGVVFILVRRGIGSQVARPACQVSLAISREEPLGVHVRESDESQHDFRGHH